MTRVVQLRHDPLAFKHVVLKFKSQIQMTRVNFWNVN